MRKANIFLCFTTVLAVLCLTTLAAPPEGAKKKEGPRKGKAPSAEGERRGPGRPGEGRRRFVPPLFAALDADGDGEISSEEIENASAALKKLDKNEDGKLTREELRPMGPPPERRGPPRGGPEGEGRRRPGGPPEGDRPGGERPRRPKSPEA